MTLYEPDLHLPEYSSVSVCWRLKSR